MADVWSRIGPSVALGSAAAYLAGVTALAQFAEPLGLTAQELGLDFRTYVVIAGVAFVVTSYVSIVVVIFLTAAFGIIFDAKREILAKLGRSKVVSSGIDRSDAPKQLALEPPRESTAAQRLTMAASVVASITVALWAILMSFLVFGLIAWPAPFIFGDSDEQLGLALLAALLLALLYLLAAFLPAEHARRLHNRSTLLRSGWQLSRLRFTIGWVLAHKLNLAILVVGSWLAVVTYTGLASRTYAHELLELTSSTNAGDVPRPPLLLGYAIRPTWVCVVSDIPHPLADRRVVRVVDSSQHAVLVYQGHVWTVGIGDRTFVTCPPR